ncbi:MAG: acyl-CoA dehydrogenase [Rhizobiaceae bacterium]|nr:acyl-CoA dehydrogenase [Rhizobiaceae bacterium]
MNFELNEDRTLLSDTLSRFLSDNYQIEKRHGFVMTDDRFSREMWAQFAELGMIGALFTEEFGGFGGQGADLMVVFEALGRNLVVEPFLPTLLAGSALARAGGQENLIEQVIAGEEMIALAHGEPAGRYELSHVETSATKEGDAYTISGNKAVVLGGASATHLVVSARTSGEVDAQDGISLFLVEKSDAVNVRDYGTLDGYPAAEIQLNKASATLLGGEGAGFDILEEAFAKATTAVCAEAFGAMEAAKDLTVEYMHTRKQFGVPIGKFQALNHRMADVLIELEQMRSAVINAAGNLDADRITREREVSACKHLCGTIGRQVAEESIQIHGGMGMTWEYPVGHFAKRIIMIDHLFGDTDHHLERYIELGRAA